MLLGIDFGLSKVGLAIVDEKAGTLPLPLAVLTYTGLDDFKRKLGLVLTDYPVDAFVVGVLPNDKAGDPEKRGKFELFLTMLKQFELPIHQVDEQRSTKAARSVAKDDPNFSTKKDDALAAQFILENYLSQHGRS